MNSRESGRDRVTRNHFTSSSAVGTTELDQPNRAIANSAFDIDPKWLVLIGYAVDEQYPCCARSVAHQDMRDTSWNEKNITGFDDCGALTLYIERERPIHSKGDFLSRGMKVARDRNSRG